MGKKKITKQEATSGVDFNKVTPEQVSQIVAIGSAFLRLNKRDVIQIIKYVIAIALAGYLLFIGKDIYFVLKFRQAFDFGFILSNSLISYIDNIYNLLIPGGLGVLLIKLFQDKTRLK